MERDISDHPTGMKAEPFAYFLRRKLSLRFFHRKSDPGRSFPLYELNKTFHSDIPLKAERGDIKAPGCNYEAMTSKGGAGLETLS